MNKLHLLVAMCIAYIFLSVLVKRKQHKLGLTSTKATTKAIWVGIFWINAPLIPLLVAPIFIQQYLFSNKNVALSFFCLVFGFIFSWLWWSVNVSLWRRWAARKGIDAVELQREGQSSSLLWPPGHLFERTEYDNIIKAFKGK